MASSGGNRRHGFDDDAQTRLLLRSPPPEAALAWVARCVGHSVARWEVLRGGTSSAMYRLAFADETVPELVLRCYVRADLNAAEPDMATREAAALRVIARSGLPTPELVAVDLVGQQVGVPAVLMTCLAGRVVWDPKGVNRWLARLAEVLPAVHASDTDGEVVGRYSNYEQVSYEPPRWAARPAVWESAIELFHGPVLDQDRCFIHRDYHPGNVLWVRGRVTGVVDWQAACVGPPSVDIGHCRANFLGYAPELADAFTRLAERVLGRPFHPWADVAALIGLLDGLRKAPPSPAGRRAIEAALDRAVIALARP